MEHAFNRFLTLPIFLAFILCLPNSMIHSLNDGPERNSSLGECDLFQGSWVYDHTYPLYETSTCPFIEAVFDCQKNGRPDELYLKYRWKPSACELPRFDGRALLRLLKGKKILFVGDSLSVNQWQSLTCMLHASDPNLRFNNYRRGGMSSFTLPDYDVSISLSRNAFLVDLVNEKKGRVLKLDSIENGKEWIGYDMLIFNTWHWWLHKGRQKPWDYIQNGTTTQRDMDRLAAFKQGLTTWSKWVGSNINPNVTKVFFQGISPTHYNGTEWTETESKTNCLGQTEPINGTTYPGGSHPAVSVVKQVINSIELLVTLLDVTKLSQLRKDGHPSIYGNNKHMGNDCSHWCLAGVPDSWNELLYSILVLEKNANI